MLCLNPTSVNSWLYKRYFKGLEYDYSGIIQNRLYVYSSYKDSLPFLSDTFVKEIQRLKETDPVKYNNQYLGKWLENDDKALLTKTLLDLALQKQDYTEIYQKVVVAIDPAVSTNQNSDNTGLAVCGKKDNHFYLLHVEEIKATPNEWSRRAKELYNEYNADFIVYEQNQGRTNG